HCGHRDLHSFPTRRSSDLTGIYEGSLGNTAVTWEKSRKFDVGLDLNLFDDKMSLTVDYFNDYRFDQLYFPGSVPSIIGVGFARRSEEHTSELQSRENLVCR